MGQTMSTVDIYRDQADEWRWRLKAGNGETVATGEGHGSHGDALRAFTGVIELLVDPAGITINGILPATEEGDSTRPEHPE
jgi:uncharacterized protein YegP (UPF0339 family)